MPKDEREDKGRFYDDNPEEERRHDTRVPVYWMRRVDNRLDRIEHRVNSILIAIGIVIAAINLLMPVIVKIIFG